jgi:hypothetical protein
MRLNTQNKTAKKAITMRTDRKGLAIKKASRDCTFALSFLAIRSIVLSEFLWVDFPEAASSTAEKMLAAEVSLMGFPVRSAS